MAVVNVSMLPLTLSGSFCLIVLVTSSLELRVSWTLCAYVSHIGQLNHDSTTRIASAYWYLTVAYPSLKGLDGHGLLKLWQHIVDQFAHCEQHCS